MSDSNKPIDINIPATYKSGFSITEKQIEEIIASTRGMKKTTDADGQEWLMITTEEGMTGFAPLP